MKTVSPMYRYRVARRLRVGDSILLHSGEYLLIARIEVSESTGHALDFYDASDKIATTIDLDAVVRVLPRGHKKEAR
jgi:hypothetical protein